MPAQPRIFADRVCARAVRFALLLSLLILSLTAVAGAAPATKTVTYRGYRVRVPGSWPVYNLTSHPSTCVRFNRHAVYLGTPSSSQSCSVQSIGRTEAILIGPAASAGRAGLNGADVARRTVHGVAATATWNRSPAVIERALGFRSLHAMVSSSPAAPEAAHTASVRTASARAATASVSTPGEIYTGKGFDVCSTPSSSHMADWGSSPYRAIGVYIGGTNRACSQPNLTSSWVTGESDDGWHLIPIYVGLQAPSNGCGCKAISPSSAASEGTGAASSAVADAEAIGIGPGNPLYFDMEGYNRTSTNTNAVLAFLQAWTEELHADGYLSGIYSSGASGITDLVSKWSTSYAEPDELWFADWNGKATTSDSYVPSDEWTDHQRLHQYSGAVNKTYGGEKLNIDQDYLSAATAAAGSGASAASATPTDLTTPTISGPAYAGQRLTERHGSWSGSPTSYSYQWYRCASTGSSCAAISGATARTFVLQTADVGATIRVTETAANTIGSSAAVASAQTSSVLPAPTSSYWLYTAYGNVYNALTAPFYGSAAKSKLTSISGMAATSDAKGYWLVDAAGRVFNYGDAAPVSAIHPAHPVIGVAAARGGGVYLLTAYGNVYDLDGAHFYGSPRASHKRVSTITGMAVTPDRRGYWLVDQAGKVFAYGDATKVSSVTAAHPIRGVVAAHRGGIWLWTSHGNVYDLAGAPFHSSPMHQGRRVSTISGMAETADGKGYWLVKSGGRVFHYGDAEPLPTITPLHSVIGTVG